MTNQTTAFLGTAHIHTPDFVNRLNKRSDEVSVKYVFDDDHGRATMRSAELAGSRVSPDIETILLDPEVTSVIICSETNKHRSLVVRAAEAGKHIFCEKPLGLGVTDSVPMADAVKAAGVIFQTGFFSRSGSVNQFIKQEVLAGHLGKITRMTYSNCHQAALDGWFDTDWRWLADPKLAGGGALLDLGAHMLDLIISTMIPDQGKVTQAAGALGSGVGRYNSEIDEYGSALLTFESGASAYFEASWVDRKLRSPWTIYGTEGQIAVVDGKVNYWSQHVEGADGAEWTKLPAAAPHAFDLWLDALQGKPLAVPLVTVEEAALGSQIMERIYASAGRSTTTGL